MVTLLVGNNVVNVAIASTVTVLAVRYLPPGVAAAIAVASLVVIVFGEVIPKSYWLGNAERWAVRVARQSASSGPLTPVCGRRNR